MEFTTMEIIGMVMHAVFIGVIIQINRQYKLEQQWREEDQRIFKGEMEHGVELFEHEHAARLEFAGLNVNLTMQRDTAYECLKPFGDAYRTLDAKHDKEFVYGCFVFMTGDGVKPLVDSKMVPFDSYVKAAALTIPASAEDSA